MTALTTPAPEAPPAPADVKPTDAAAPVDPNATPPVAPSKDAVAAKPADVAAAEAALKFPDGFQPDVALLDAVKPMFKEFGLKGEQQQKLVDAFIARQAESEKASDAQFAEMKAGYLTALKSDKELGGAKYDATLGNVQRAYSKFGTPEFTKLMEDSGLGNHPEIVRAFARIGAAMSDDSISGARGSGGPSAPDARERLYEQYPTMRPGAAQPGPK